MSQEYFASQEEEENGVQEEGFKQMTVNVEVIHRDCSQVARDHRYVDCNKKEDPDIT